MTPRRGATTAPELRLGVPRVFTEGRFEQVLIMTFGADLEFYERVLRRHFATYRNQIVLVDGQQLDRTVGRVAMAGTLRHLNRSWIAGPVRTVHAAHAKLILLAASETAVLLVGSGNLHMGGYAGAGECFTPYRWSPGDPGELSAFTAVRALTDGLRVRGLLDSVTVERLGVFWGAYDWWHDEPIADGPVRHNLDVPLGEQLVEAVGDERVEELVVAAPFHDPHCAALEKLVSELRPRHVRVLVQPGQASIDPKKLAAVLQPCGGEVFSCEAAGDAVRTYLHAKVFIAKTKGRAVCLTGSANSSVVALWARHPHANIELGNLKIGQPDDFDYLFDPETLTLQGPVDPSTLGIKIQTEPDDDADISIRVVDLRWDPPIVSGTVYAALSDASAITVEVQGRVVAAKITLAKQTLTSTYLTARLTDAADIEAVERVAAVTVRIGNEATAATVPYQVGRLREQDRRRVDADRLRHAARLELDDPDLEQALAALEEILIGENVARWTHGRDNAAPTDDDNSTTISWEEIDWAAVRRHPRFAAYGEFGGLAVVAGSDLAAYLDALSQAVSDLAEPDPTPPSSSSGTPSQEDDDEDREPDHTELTGGVEGAEVDDVVDEEEIPTKRRQSIAARNLRLIRNFVRRNLRALEQPAFREGAGPGIVIPNVIILNWVCWWVATKDEERPAELVEERRRLWRLLWGSGESSGYLSELDDEHSALVLERFDDQRFEAVTLASIVDIWAYTEYEDKNFRSLRDILRRAVSDVCWQVSAQHLVPAARLVNGRPTTPDALDAVAVAEALWDVACHPVGDADVRAAIAEAASVAPGLITMRDQSVVVDDTSVPRPVAEAMVAASLSSETVERALAAWRGVEDLDFYRVKWDGGVALYRAAEENGWRYFEADGEPVAFGFIAASDPPWRIELDRLTEAAEQAAEVAA